MTRWVPIGLLLFASGCAAHRPVHTVRRHSGPTVTAPATLAPAEARGGETRPMAAPAATPVSEGPGASVPMQGFRPMRSQTRPAI